MTVYDNGPRDRVHYGAVVTGCTDDRLWKKYMQEWYGLTAVRGDGWFLQPRCIHKLIDKKCLSHTCPVVRKYDSHHVGIWDHARAWKNGSGEKVFTSEPWGDPLDTAQARLEMERELAELGITVSFEGRSPYGASYILFFTDTRTEEGAQAATFQAQRLNGLQRTAP